MDVEDVASLASREGIVVILRVMEMVERCSELALIREM